MKLAKDLSELLEFQNKEGEKRIGLVIGNFDGVHLGHRELIRSLKDKCESGGLDLAIMTFVPHPLQVLNPQAKRFLINSYDDRRVLLKDLSVNYLIEVDFNDRIRNLRPKEFLYNFILKYGQIIERIFLGYDFSFGINREGGIDLVVEEAEKLGIHVDIESEFRPFQERISSSIIRSLICQGSIVRANIFLGREFFLTGKVVSSAGRGRVIGFPTANLSVGDDRLLPANGVYITKTIYNGIQYQSVTNIGINPTFENGEKVHVETHILDSSLDLYDEKISIIFIKRLRDEMKFESAQDLVRQIHIDVMEAKKYFCESMN